jgi:hypothetical protein
MLRHLIALSLAAAVIVSPAPVQPAADQPPKSAAEVAALADALAASLVRVEVTPQYDKGESPGEDRWAAWRQFQSQRDDDSSGWESWDQLVKEERPAERGGFLIAPNRVYTQDPGLHPRFIKSINVRFGAQVVAAKPVGWPVGQSGVIYELASPLEGAKPLSFDPSKPGPYLGVSYVKRDATWMTRVGSLRSGVVVAADGRRYVAGDPGVLVIDRDGVPVTISGSTQLPVDGSWKKPVADWPMLDAAGMADALKNVEALAAGQILRVTLNFRSPRNAGEPRGRWRGGGDDESESMTEWNGLGVLTDPQTIIILANLQPKITGRLERIRVFSPSGDEWTASFTGTLKNWGAFVARLDSPAPAPARMASADITDIRDRLLLKAAVTVRGETRTAYFSHDRVSSFFTSYRGHTFPQFDAGGAGDGYSRYYGSGGPEYLNFLYTQAGELVGIPMNHREKVTVRERYGFSGSQTYLVPADMVVQMLAAGAAEIDAENRPLTEDEENRLAWLGVEMQGMDPDLARANDVMDETNGGMSGGIITYLYPDSPAAKAGLKEGDIILRLQVEGHPKPLEVQVDDPMGFGMMEQFWAQLDRVPEEYFDRLPRPWGSVETALTRSLTDLGFGTPFVADVWRDGKIMQVPMIITQGPAHYDAAARYKSESLGLTVRDLTYEVRRYFQLKNDEPGVIISKVEPGSKASVAGLKPYEIIRTIDDQPVPDVKAFESMVAKGGELRLAVKRMTQGRTVKIKADAPTAAPVAPAAGATDDGGGKP